MKAGSKLLTMQPDRDSDAGRGTDMVTVARATAVRDACPGFCVQFMHFLDGSHMRSVWKCGGYSGAASRTDNELQSGFFIVQHNAERESSGIYAELLCTSLDCRLMLILMN